MHQSFCKRNSFCRIDTSLQFAKAPPAKISKFTRSVNFTKKREKEEKERKRRKRKRGRKREREDLHADLDLPILVYTTLRSK